MNTTLLQVQTLATHTGTSVFSFASSFLVVLVLFGALFFFARYVGRGQFVALLVSFYTGYTLYSVFPFASLLPSTPASTALITDLALFGAFVAATYIILRRVVVSDFLSIGTIGLFILSLLAAGFLLALAYHVFPVRSVYSFTPAIDALFAPKGFFFWWFIAPLLGLFVFAK